ncbi:MAG TPA: class I SAM-dependent methyltransferase [Rhizomicrobium sp.]|jgi:predicted O-methyltransferase YrrM
MPETTAANDLQGILKTAASAVSRLALWETIINALKPETVLELGVWRGDFAAHILAHCPSIKRYYLLDPWRPLPEWNKPFNASTAVFDDAYRATIEATRFAADRVTVLRGTTVEAIGQIPDGSVDFAYVDGDHTLRGIAIDLINTYPKLRDGGWLAGDDFVPSIWQHKSRFEPTMIFPYALYFAEAHRLPVYALPHAQFLMHKRPDTYSFTDLVGTYGRHDVLHHVRFSTLLKQKLLGR